MYKPHKPDKTQLKINTQYFGESIEAKVRRLINNKEPINDATPLIYTERKDGVLPEYDVRTDRFEIALEAMDAASKSWVAKREDRLKAKDIGKQTQEGMKKENQGDIG